MQAKMQVKVRATWTFRLISSETQELIKEIRLDNVLTNAAKNFFAQAYGNGTFRSGKTWFLVLGTGTGNPSPSDTNLFQPVASTAKTGQLTVTDNKVQFYVRYESNEANGYTFTEAGIFDNADPSAGYTSGQLINHVLISPPITKDSSLIIDARVTIEFV